MSKVRLLDEIRVAQAHAERESLDLFREHATRVAFCLSLTKRQVRLLLWMWRTRKSGEKASDPLGERRLFVPDIQGLIARGLVIHTFVEPQDPMRFARTRKEAEVNEAAQYYKLTRAGMLVAELADMASVGEII